MEHLNREYKTSLCGLGSNITDHSVQRIGKCLGKTTKMMQHFDEISDSLIVMIDVPKGDLDRVLNQLKEKSEVFRIHEGRKHSYFSKFTSAIQSNKVALPELKQWMADQYSKLLI